MVSKLPAKVLNFPDTTKFFPKKNTFFPLLPLFLCFYAFPIHTRYIPDTFPTHTRYIRISHEYSTNTPRMPHEYPKPPTKMIEAPPIPPLYWLFCARRCPAVCSTLLSVRLEDCHSATLAARRIIDCERNIVSIVVHFLPPLTLCTAVVRRVTNFV